MGLGEVSYGRDSVVGYIHREAQEAAMKIAFYNKVGYEFRCSVNICKGELWRVWNAETSPGLGAIAAIARPPALPNNGLLPGQSGEELSLHQMQTIDLDYRIIRDHESRTASSGFLR